MWPERSGDKEEDKHSSHRRAIGERRCSHTHWMPDGPAPGAQSCTLDFQEHGKGRSSLSFPPLPPVQTVLNEKDKFRVSTALCTFTYGLSKENDTPC